MKKILIFLTILALVVPCFAQKSTTSVPMIQGDILHTIQNAWVIADSTLGGTTTTALTVSQRTKLLAVAAIAAGANDQDEISIFPIPSKWNGLQFRGMSVDDEDVIVHTLYLGTLGGLLDCHLDRIGILTWTTGLQQSVYSQITFASGGTYVPQIGDIVTGVTSGETAEIFAISALTSGTWAAGTAAGTVTYRSASGTFTNSEKVSISKAGIVITDDAYTHPGNDVVDFLLAQTVVLSGQKTWSDGITWKTASPSSDLVAEAELDVKGADILVVVSTTTVDSKLIVKGY